MGERYNEAIKKVKIAAGGFAGCSVRVETDDYRFQAIMYVYGRVLMTGCLVIRRYNYMDILIDTGVSTRSKELTCKLIESTAVFSNGCCSFALEADDMLLSPRLNSFNWD